jgi:hypothetical protein
MRFGEERRGEERREGDGSRDEGRPVGVLLRAGRLPPGGAWTLRMRCFSRERHNLT